MVEISRRTFAVTATGVGRKDYSQNVEYSVEPLTRSWEETYQYYNDAISLPTGTTMIDITLVPQTVIFIYDYVLSVPKNVLLNLRVTALTTAGVEVNILRRDGYQRVEYHMAKGYPFFNTIRVRMTNYSADTVNAILSLVGIVSGEHEYYLSLSEAHEPMTV